MKNSKEYKISVVLFSVAIALFLISLVTGLIPSLQFAIDEICKYLGFACLGFGFVFLNKANHLNDSKEQ